MKRWKRVEYERLVDRGVFEPGDRIELIDGLLLVSEPQSSAHYTAIRLVERVLTRAFGEGWDVRTQAPIALDDISEPEPDVAVVRGTPRDYSTSHPAHPQLVVEVAASSLDFDREHKASLYARGRDRKSTRLNSSHEWISYAVFCLKKKQQSRGRRYGSLFRPAG